MRTCVHIFIDVLIVIRAGLEQESFLRAWGVLIEKAIVFPRPSLVKLKIPL